MPLISNQVDSVAEGPDDMVLGTANGPMRRVPFSRVASAAATRGSSQGEVMAVAIVTDSGSDLTPAQLNETGVRQVP